MKEGLDDSDYEEEESLVLVELSGIIETDLISRAKECKVLGIDTEKPLLQLDKYIFQGEYEDAVGTCMLLEEKTLPESAEFDSEPQKELNFRHLTNKKLNMQRVFIKKTVEEDTEQAGMGGDEKTENMEIDYSLSQPSTSSVSQTGSISQTDLHTSSYQTASDSPSVDKDFESVLECTSGLRETKTEVNPSLVTGVDLTHGNSSADFGQVHTVVDVPNLAAENSSVDTK